MQAVYNQQKYQYFGGSGFYCKELLIWSEPCTHDLRIWTLRVLVRKDMDPVFGL